MRRTMAAAIALTVAGLVLASALARPSQQQNCMTDPCVYVPVIQVPLPSPAPSVTPMPSGVVVLPNHSSYVDNLGLLWVIGEVQNTTVLPVHFVQVPAVLLDGQGQQLTTGFGSMHLYSLPPGEKTCFSLIFTNKPGWASYQFDPVTYAITSDVPPGLTLRDIAGAASGVNYSVIGTVRNDAGAFVDSILLNSTLYNAAGTVIDCDWSVPDDDTLSAGQSSPFEVIFSGRPTYIDVASIRVQVDGDIP